MQLSINELKKQLDSIVFNERESDFYEKCKNLIDTGFKMEKYDSSDKVLYAVIIYYILQVKRKKLNK